MISVFQPLTERTCAKDPSPPASFSSPCRQLRMIPLLTPPVAQPFPPLPAPDNDGVVPPPDPWPAGSSKAVIGVPRGLAAGPVCFWEHIFRRAHKPGISGEPHVSRALLEADEALNSGQQRGRPGSRNLRKAPIACPGRCVRVLSRACLIKTFFLFFITSLVII